MSPSRTTDTVRAFVAFNRVRPLRYFCIDVVVFGLPLVLAAPADGFGPAAAVGLASMLAVRGSALTIDDYVDARSDEIEKPHRPIPSGLVSRRDALRMAIALVAVGLVTAAAVGPAFLLAVVLLYVLLAADPLLFDRLAVPGLTTVVTVTAVSMLGVMGWVVYGDLTPGLLAAFAMTWWWDLGHDTIGAYLDREGDERADIRSLGRDLPRRTVAGIVGGSQAVSLAILGLAFAGGVLEVAVPVVLFGWVLSRLRTFVRDPGRATAARNAVEWYVVGSYAWVGGLALLRVA